MARYTGNTCPICKEKFKASDDIVVCPDCGTPYHRACWKTVGACVHAAEHATGFEWKPDAVPEEVHAAVCANCGTQNTPGATHCSHCSVPLDAHRHAAEKAANQEGSAPVYTRGSSPYNGGAPGGAAAGPRLETFATDKNGGIYRREVGPDDAIDGIKARDWASYVGQSHTYFLMQFFRLSTQKHSLTACFSALIFGPAYLFYRKMWKEGLLTGALFLLLQIPSWVDIIATFNPGLIPTLPATTMSVILTACSVALWVLRVVIMLYAVVWYKQESSQRILSIYDRIPEGSARTSALQAAGGTSIVAAVLCVVAYYGFIIVCMNLAGPEFFRALMAASGLSI